MLLCMLATLLFWFLGSLLLVSLLLDVLWIVGGSSDVSVERFASYSATNFSFFFLTAKVIDTIKFFVAKSGIAQTSSDEEDA